MATAQGAAPPAAPDAQGAGIGGAIKNAAFAWAAVQGVQWLVSGKKPFSTPPPPAPPSTSSDPAAADTPHGVAQPGPAAPVNSPKQQQQQQVQQQVPPLVPTWPHKSLLDVAIRLSPELDPLAVDLRDSSFPSVTWTAVEYSNTKWGHVWETEWAVPDSVQHNASFFLDAFVTRTGLSPDPRDESYPGKGEVLHIRKPLIRYAPQKRVRATKNLLSGKPDDDEDAAAEAKEDEDWKSRPFVSYYYPNVTLELVGDAANVAYATLPPPVKQHVHIAREGAKTFDDKQAYFPILFPNTFWDLSSQLQPVNTTTPVLPLRVEFKPSGYFKFQLQSTMDEAFTKQSAAMGGASSGGELDEIKRILIETNPVLLITTVVVSVLHMLFEFLAFAGDIAHTRSRKGLVGVSVRTILTNVFVQFVVLLYLIDQSEETNYMIIMSSGIGLAIEAWKITKAVDVRLVRQPAQSLVPYKVEFHDKHVLNEDELRTQEYDRAAFKIVGLGTTPFLVGWTIYSMLYQSHRSWYSFVIQTLTSFVQMFGFVQLVPQLIINYKLKSVAHIPMKAMMYKSLSTVIDDFFSFIIKMPLLHRLACFRDDVVFLVLLYQKWIYRVDYSRENEYGQKFDEAEAKKQLDKKAHDEQARIKAEGVETKKTQ